MATFSTNEFKTGLKIIQDDYPCVIVENEFVKPGKGQAFNRVRFRNLKTGRVIERTFKSGESVVAADVEEMEVQFLYADADGEHWHFMSPESFEQYAVTSAVMTDTKQWLKGQEVCTLMLWNGQPIGVTPPNFVILAVKETDPGLRGDTSGGGSKAAKLESGAVVRVPLFIQEGDLLKIDTRVGEYVSRAKE